MSRIEELERRVRQDPASIAFGALAEEYRRAGRLEEAIAACRAGLDRHPSYLSARVTLGRALQEIGHPADARAEYEYVLSIAPDNLAAIRGLAELHGTTEPDVEPIEPIEPTEPTEPIGRQGSGSLIASQIERLEIWLTTLEQARESLHDSE